MRTILNIIQFLLFGSMSCYAQEGVVLPLDSPPSSVATGVYLKDTENTFGPYLGTWQGTWAGKTLNLVLTKVSRYKERFPDGDYHYEDRIMGRYWITDNVSGATLSSTMNTLSISSSNLLDIGISDDNFLSLLYIDKTACSFTAEIRLKRNLSDANIMSYIFIHKGFIPMSDCPYADILEVPIAIPIVELTLTKVN